MATQQNASFFSIPVFHSSSEFRVNTAFFSQNDLTLFIENMETIEGLRRQKYQRRQHFEEKVRETRLILENSLQISTHQSNMGCLPSPSSMCGMPSPTSSVIEELEELCIKKETPKRICKRLESPTDLEELIPKRPVSMRRSSDEEETYFSDASDRSNRTPTSVAKKPRLLFATTTKPLKSNINSGSDSEESGIYPLICTPQQKQYRKRTSALIEKPKRSAGSRILALLLRREILRDQQKQQPEEIVHIKKATSNLNVSKEHGDENDLHEFIKQKYKRFALRYIRRLKKHVVVEEEQEKPSDLEMLDKALRYMTL
ncbi:uncharacterized protein LOC105212093 [Zeugodacus cucurbitae]|uniref:uncharacterized protein LOC105212093 n=1 Tax=Zeugodacus cucurbitae TaxID=28588 RepID=UPI0023D9006D|nr:uncharacterized protein LOC105212093 [Zeugodacus cucurbitae]